MQSESQRYVQYSTLLSFIFNALPGTTIYKHFNALWFYSWLLISVTTCLLSPNMSSFWSTKLRPRMDFFKGEIIRVLWQTETITIQIYYSWYAKKKSILTVRTRWTEAVSNTLRLVYSREVFPACTGKDLGRTEGSVSFNDAVNCYTSI